VTDVLKHKLTPSRQGITSAMMDGYFDGLLHRYPLRVQYEDTDAGGIVYHAKYLAYAERGRSAWLRCLGVDQASLLDDARQGFVVRRIEVDFLQPARLGTAIDVSSTLLRLGGASLKLCQNITNIEDGHILARLIVDIGFVRLSADMPPCICRLPAELKARLSGLVTPLGNEAR
jgi:acyl-CoA thioester hydrolase